MTGNLLGWLAVSALAASLGALACSSAHDPGPQADARLADDLRQLARLRVFFGHQSIGTNILDGLRELGEQAGVRIPITRVDDARQALPPGIAHAFVGSNGDPQSKLAAFDRALPPEARVDVALVKLCFVDVDERTDVTALFAEYQKRIRALRARHPGTVFVHVTAPLQVDQGRIKTTLKQLLGRGHGTVANDARREQLNELMRAAYGEDRTVFDLARLEATRADGRLETGLWRGRPVPVLLPAYSDDGAHLGPVGRRHVARAFASFLASIAAQRSLVARS